MVKNSAPNHPWIGATLFDGCRFLGTVREVSDNGKEDLYITYTYNDDCVDYCWISRYSKQQSGVLLVE